VEWFPWKAASNPTTATPFLALGLEEYGVHHIDPTLQAQIGIYLGNHFREQYHPTLRFVIGGYTGADPRMKYAAIKLSKVNFIYAGAMFNF
jgi:hypothetical protein